MNIYVPRKRTIRRSYLYTPFKRSDWFNEIEKRRAIKNNTYPIPSSIKYSLGEHLGQIVIDTIPTEVLHQFTTKFNSEKLAEKFGMTFENLSSGNKKLTPVDNDDDMASNFRTLQRNRDHLKSRMLPKWEDEQNSEMESLLNKLKNENNINVAEKTLIIRDVEKHAFELESEVITNMYNSTFLETKQSIEEKIMNKCTKKIKKNSIRIVREMKKLLTTSAEEREKELMDTFDYHMELARSELFEKFQNEKFKLECQWEEEEKILREKNETLLENLRKSLEKKYALSLIELEQWYEMKNKTIPIKVDDKAEEEEGADENLLHSALQIRQINNELLDRNRELLVYKKRLNYILNGYIDYIENNLQPKQSCKKSIRRGKNYFENIKQN